jgi:hypothetical protein
LEFEDMRDYRGEFEVHVTVNTPTQDALDRFREWCRAREFKCVRIELARGAYVDQPMATWRRSGTVLSCVVAEAEQYADEMKSVGFPVVRVKVEAALQNDGIPVQDPDARVHDAGNYFEHHVKLLRATTAPRELLLHACEKFGAHLSRNAFRETANGQEERFVTLRTYAVGRLSSENQLQGLLAVLGEAGEEIIGCESEYCVYDTNLSVDAGWLREQT